MGESLSRSLARFASSLEFDALPAEVVDKIKASLLHALVIGIVGAGTEHGKAAIALAKQEESKDDGATILADGARATRVGAAYANSALMHATNQSDSYRMLIHPGPCVIPAALAAAELGGRSGKELLTALVAGYEVETRIAWDFIPTTQARGFRSSPVYGTWAQPLPPASSSAWMKTRWSPPWRWPAPSPAAPTRGLAPEARRCCSTSPTPPATG